MFSYCSVSDQFLIVREILVKSKKNYQPIVVYVRCNDVTQTQTRQLENRSGTEVLQMQQNVNINVYKLN